ncbi:hypothetical protein A9Q86_14465 [Flavobacteriales bacterium 33_180_T64]|nr:hypothetical protein A9Q86_14465 [Flavobacteriales bacterium 33_180_T64]
MKKLILCVFTFFFSMAISAQDESRAVDDQNPKNEVKVNALYMVIGSVDLTYERLLNEESAVGLNVVIPFDEAITDDLNYYFSPYYRLYFGKKYAGGFFLEGFGLLSSVNSTERFLSGSEFDPVIITREEKVTDFALGIGLGGKWITNNGFVGELGFGIGRNLTNTDDNVENFVAKIGITIGYRF